MFSDGHTFLKRQLVFFGELKRGVFPNASTLAAQCQCSRSTAQRSIDRLARRSPALVVWRRRHRSFS